MIFWKAREQSVLKGERTINNQILLRNEIRELKNIDSIWHIGSFGNTDQNKFEGLDMEDRVGLRMGNEVEVK